MARPDCRADELRRPDGAAWRSLLGLRRALPALVGAALLRMRVMEMSDWLNCNLMLSYRIATSLRTGPIGGPYLMLPISHR